MFSQPARKNSEPSELAFKARQKNVLGILQGLAQKNQEQVDMEAGQPTPAKEKPKGSKAKKGQESWLKGLSEQGAPQQQQHVPLPQVEAELDAVAFDEEGNFKPPPYKGYWLEMLEKINANDPYKTGRDWRDEAIEKFRAAEAALDEAEASLGVRR